MRSYLLQNPQGSKDEVAGLEHERQRAHDSGKSYTNPQQRGYLFKPELKLGYKSKTNAGDQQFVIDL